MATNWTVKWDDHVLALNTAHVLALNTAHVLHLNKVDVLALNKAHVLRLNSKICPVFSQSYRTTFFDFFRDLRNGIIPFESVFGRSLSKHHLKTIGFRWEGCGKVKKTLHRSATESPSTDIYIKLEPFGIHPRIPGIQRIQRIRCQRLRLGPYLPHAPGARMTVVKLTPSN